MSCIFSVSTSFLFVIIVVATVEVSPVFVTLYPAFFKALVASSSFCLLPLAFNISIFIFDIFVFVPAILFPAILAGI